MDLEKEEHIMNNRKIGPSYVKSTTSKKKKKGIYIYFYKNNLIDRVGSPRVARGDRIIKRDAYYEWRV